MEKRDEREEITEEYKEVDNDNQKKESKYCLEEETKGKHE